jgi:transketolase
VATIEAGRTDPWKQLTGSGGLNIGVDRFGASAPAGVLAEKLGLTADSVTGRIRDWLDGRKPAGGE